MNLKVQSYKLYNNKYMVTSTQITNTEILAFIAILIFKLLSRKVLFINRKDKRNYKNVGFFKGNYFKIIKSWNAKFSGYF